MIRSKLKKLSTTQVVLSVIVVLGLLWSFNELRSSWLISLRLNKAVRSTIQIELNLHEEAKAAFYALSSGDILDISIVEDAHQEWKRWLTHLDKCGNPCIFIGKNSDLRKRLVDSAECFHEKLIQLLFIQQEINRLLDLFIDNLQKVDDLLAEGFIPKSLQQNGRERTTAFKLEINLAKVARQLGLFLRCDAADELLKLRGFLEHCETLQLTLESLVEKDKDKDQDQAWLNSLTAILNTKHAILNQIIKLHQKKAVLLKEEGKLLKNLDNLLGGEIQTFLEKIKLQAESNLVLALRKCIFTLLLLFAMLFYFELQSRKIQREIEIGLNGTLAISQQIFSGENRKFCNNIESDNEFSKISNSLINAHKKMLKISFSFEQVDMMLNQIGEIRFVVERNGNINRLSKLLLVFFQGDVNGAIQLIKQKTCDFVTACSLLEADLLKDIVLNFGKSENSQLVQLSAVFLDRDTIMFFGKLYKTSKFDNVESLGALPRGMIQVDNQGVILKTSASVNLIWQMENSPLEGIKISDLCANQYCNLHLTPERLKSHSLSGKTSELIVNHDRLKRKRYALLHVHPIKNSQSGVAFVIILDDITAIRQSEELTRKLAFFDDLTGLPNRAQFMQQLEMSVAGAKRVKHKIALLFLDMNRFKNINDTMGHDIGDELLKTIACRIQTSLRKSDFAARLGGDEFCILIEFLENEVAAEKFAYRLLRNLNMPVLLSGHQVSPSCSVGIAIYPNDGVNAQQLLKAADTAMHSAKQNKNSDIAFYSPEMTKRAEYRLVIESQLRNALKKREFRLYYQPQVDILTGKIVGVEALIRWTKADGTIIPPIEFIPICEEIGLMQQLGRWVLNEACRQVKEWNIDGLRMAVNISASHFESPTLISDIEQALKKYQLPAKLLEIEITEEATRNVSKHIEMCKKISKIGVNVAVDDFGTGYSSLAVLRKLELHTLKIDRQFIEKLTVDPRTALMAGSIVAMAKGLELETVIEGVETEEQLKVLFGLGCRIVQGYFFSPPIPAEQIPNIWKTGFLEVLQNTLPISREV